MQKVQLFLIVALTVLNHQLFAQQPGDLDPIFGNNGIVTTVIDTNSDKAVAMVLQPTDGKIVLAGTSTKAGSERFALARYNPDGTLDTSFGNAGKVITVIGPPNGGHDAVTCMTIQPEDNKILVAGSSFNGTNSNTAIVRYNTDGTLDKTFSGDGKLVMDLNTPGFPNPDGARAIGILKVGARRTILIVGFTFNGTASDMNLLWLKPDGTLDSFFNGTGVIKNVNLNFAPGSVVINNMSILPGLAFSRILLGCVISNGTSSKSLLLMRFFDTGKLDSTFGTNGRANFNSAQLGGSGGTIQSLAVQPDGNIVAAAVTGNGSFGLLRYTKNGNADTSFFSHGGSAVTSAGGAMSVALQPDGKIIAAGFTQGTTTGINFAVYRYNTNGILDDNFNFDGKTTTDINHSDDAVNAMALQPDGKIVVAGTSTIGANSVFAVARYLTEANLGLIDFDSPVNTAFIYPNPIEHSATIEYSLKSNERITLQLLDLQGRVLKTFMEQEQQIAGNHKQEIILPDGLAEGGYLINLSTATGHVSVRIIK